MSGEQAGGGWVRVCFCVLQAQVRGIRHVSVSGRPLSLRGNQQVIPSPPPTHTAPLQLGVDGGAGDPALRPFWRGRMGLSKLEQRDLFESVRPLLAAGGGATLPAKKSATRKETAGLAGQHWWDQLPGCAVAATI